MSEHEHYESDDPRQLAIFDSVRFHGADYDESRDGTRLRGQLGRVYEAMSDSAWLTMEQVVERIERQTGRREKVTSVDRQRRYLDALDGLSVERRHEGNGLYRYRLVRKGQEAA